MKIIVLMKQVAKKDAILRINREEKWIEESDLSYEVNESDGYALEEALRLKEKHGGEVVVCSMGPQRVKSVIKDALARGADRAIHLVGDEVGHLGPYAWARALAEAIRYATLKGIMAAKKKEIREVTPSAEALGAAGRHQSISKIYFPQKTKQTQF